MDSSKLMPTAAEIADLTSGISELQVPDDFDELEKLVLAKQKEVEDQRGIVNSINALLKHLEKSLYIVLTCSEEGNFV
ncbi:hypothetical protein HA402_001399 [Bradysia odoriphaga]|nr:hypothetical protein HA402_001399 [Bradysia odoriphaga]